MSINDSTNYQWPIYETRPENTYPAGMEPDILIKLVYSGLTAIFLTSMDVFDGINDMAAN